MTSPSKQKNYVTITSLIVPRQIVVDEQFFFLQDTKNRKKPERVKKLT